MAREISKIFELLVGNQGKDQIYSFYATPSIMGLCMVEKRREEGLPSNGPTA